VAVQRGSGGGASATAELSAAGRAAPVVTPAPDPATSSTEGVDPTTAPSPATTAPSPTTAAPVPAAAPPDPYRGAGTWVDAFDFNPPHAPKGVPTVTPAQVDAMADVGVRTLYLQAARPNDPLAPGDLLDPELLGQFLVRAHARGMLVVAWYLPHLDDVANDQRHLQAIADFRSQGQRFDSIALDIEWRSGVSDHCERSRRLVALSQWLRGITAGQRLAAVVMPPVVTDVLNLDFWPCYPWGEMTPLYDVWMPMVYWTNRAPGTPWRDAYTYTAENLRLLRAHVPGAVIHPIGGIGDQASAEDYAGFLRAAGEFSSIGTSIYDWYTQAADTWPLLTGR